LGDINFFQEKFGEIGKNDEKNLKDKVLQNTLRKFFTTKIKNLE